MQDLQEAIQSHLSPLVQAKVEQEISAFAEGVTDAFQSPSNNVSTIQLQQFALTISLQAIATALQDDNIAEQIRLSIQTGAPIPDLPGFEAINELIDMHVRSVAVDWHSRICDRLAKLEDDQNQVNESHQALINEQKKFKALVVSINDKLDRKEKAANAMLKRAREFRKDTHFRKVKNYLYIFYELADAWILWLMLVFVVFGAGTIIGLRFIPQSIDVPIIDEILAKPKGI